MSGFPRTWSFVRWTIFGILIGIVAGLGAIAFHWMLTTSTRLFLGGLAGVYPPTPAGEGNTQVGALGRTWLLPAVVALGGLASGLLVFLLAPEAEGHGTDAAIEAFHHRGGRVRARVIPIKTLASALTIGSGGSGGREGPTAQISSGFGSILAGLLHLDTSERRILVAAGIGSGIGSIFRAPLGGAVLSAEILYIHDLEIEVLFPSLIASVVGYSIFGAWAGWEPIFGSQPELQLGSPLQLGYYAILGLICGAVGVAYAGTFYRIADIFHRLRIPRWSGPCIGGLGVGLLGLLLPQALGTGYGWLQYGMSDHILALPIWIVLLLPFAKILATSLSIASGGSGGIFGPGMVIGGMVGAACWRLTHTILPGMPPGPAPFTIVAMMALFGGIAHAPLAVMLMVAEMTGNLSLLAPAMIAVGLATLVTGNRTIYRSQVPARTDSPAHRYQFSFPLLGTLTVRDAMSRPALLLEPGMSPSHARDLLVAAKVSGAPVLGGRGRVLGVLTMGDLERAAAKGEDAVEIGYVMTHEPVTARPDMSLDVAFETLAGHNVSWMPVVEGREQNLIGIVSAADIARAYRRAFRSNVAQLRGLAANTVLLGFRIPAGSNLAGKELRQVALPSSALVISIARGGGTVLPHGNTVLLAADRLTVMASRAGETEVRAFLKDLEEVQPGEN
jgi:CIC family chloride channel protein